MAASSFFLALPVPRSAPLMAFCRRSEMAGSSAGHGCELGVPDAGGGPEEGLVGDARDDRDLLLDEREVADRLSVERQLSLRPLAREALDQAALAAIDLELQDDLGVGLRAPAVDAAHVLAVGVRLAEEHQLEGLVDGRLAGLVGAAHDGQAGCRPDVQLGVALDVGQAEAGDAHRLRPASRGQGRRGAGGAQAAAPGGPVRPRPGQRSPPRPRGAPPCPP